MEKDPPPDLLIEVDATSPSLNRLPIYAALGVPEIWIYKDEKVKFLRLYGEVYQEISNSLTFSFLDGKTATEFLHRGLEESSTKWIREIREWINKNK